MPSTTTTTFAGLSPDDQVRAHMLARGLGRSVVAFTFHHGDRHESTWASLPGFNVRWLL